MKKSAAAGRPASSPSVRTSHAARNHADEPAATAKPTPSGQTDRRPPVPSSIGMSTTSATRNGRCANPTMRQYVPPPRRAHDQRAERLDSRHDRDEEQQHSGEKRLLWESPP